MIKKKKKLKKSNVNRLEQKKIYKEKYTLYVIIIKLTLQNSSKKKWNEVLDGVL